MAEKELRKYIAEKLKGHTSQIESHATAVGIFDTNNHHAGCDVWIELKFTRDKKPFKIRPAQRTWAKRRFRAGCHSLWILWRHEDKDGRTHGLIHADIPGIEGAFSHTSLADWRSLSVATWGREIDGEQLNTLVRRYDI